MPSNTKRAVYFEGLPAPVFAEIVRGRSDIDLVRMEYDAPEAEVWQTLGTAQAYQVSSARDELPRRYFVDDAFLARVPGLLLVSTNGAGFDTVDLEACTRAGVLVVNQAGGNREGVAEHALAMMLNLSKKIIQVDRAMRRDAGLKRTAFMGNDLLEKTVGIVGLGHVGTRLAELVRGLFHAEVLAYDPYLSAEEIATRGGTKVELDDLLRRADFVSINCPLTDETRGLIGARQYALMKPTAYFVTTARGFIHDEAALHEALTAGKLAGAGLDVWDVEPPRLDNPLLQLDNVLASFHTAGVTKESRHKIATIGAEQLIATLDGERPPRILNPAVWPRYAERYREAFGTPVKNAS